ncbi:MAG: patatin-like phospholipase family protein [Alphaproteobacteria bacterium]
MTFETETVQYDAKSAVKSPPIAKRRTKKLNLALQGGGAHGAFAWGVIDRLMESGEVDIDSIVGTSAGAMNAAVAAYGLATGGADGARKSLHDFWHAVSKASASGPLQPTWWDKLMSPGNIDISPGYMMLDALTRVMSPYQLNPSNYNPLRDVLAKAVDFETLRNAMKIKLFLCASNVRTGRIKVFDREQITLDAVMASACLPFLFQAVEIDGEAYWDGGYMGNPPLYPLIYHSEVRDILIVQLNPINIPETPKTAQAILDRINTLSFNSSLIREMRAISFVTKLIDNGFDDGGRLKRMLIHTVEAEDVLSGFGASSKLNADWDFLMRLFRLGRQRADYFLEHHFDMVGRESSTRIDERFL